MADSPLAGQRFSFDELPKADLVVDSVYDGGSKGTMGDDPISHLFKGVGNQGGIRYVGSAARGTVRLAVLYTSGTDVDWPDFLDLETGTVTYYGDNKKPGRELHDTQPKGNILLRDSFAASHGDEEQRLAGVPPFLLFQREPGAGRAVRFRGLLVPGGPAISPDDELAAIWRSSKGRRFQNYRARFTVLDHGQVSREWIEHVISGGNPLDGDCPPPWAVWIRNRTCIPLLAPATTVIRTKTEQLPDDKEGWAILAVVRNYFQGREHYFERCAAGLWRMVAPRTGTLEITRPSRDGGRDAVGQYILGPASRTISIDFALEAKCYSPDNSVGVREMSRLISRLRHRNFGVLVTTSHFHKQVQEEVEEDAHPIVMISGRDIVEILRMEGRTTAVAVQRWLEETVPLPQKPA
ncbi:restriction endonuclease [Streptomyces sp. NPDC002387]|uniref:restriction endonuclease n=1 Tax=Streptomyces sp. NPDC002387 TaxID=3364643 RepID=UPI0036C9F3F6